MNYSKNVSHKRDKGNIKNIGHVFCFLELIGSCAKNLQKAPNLEEYYPTLAWLQDEIQPTIQSLVDMMDVKLAYMYLSRVDRIVLNFVKASKKRENSISEHGDVWMITAMAMMIDDIMQAVRDPKKIRILEVIEDTIIDLQKKFDMEDFDLYDDANKFVKEVSTIMYNTK